MTTLVASTYSCWVSRNRRRRPQAGRGPSRACVRRRAAPSPASTHGEEVFGAGRDGPHLLLRSPPKELAVEDMPWPSRIAAYRLHPAARDYAMLPRSVGGGRDLASRPREQRSLASPRISPTSPEFTEIETGKGSDALDRRPQLAAALAAARTARSPVVVAKLDRTLPGSHGRIIGIGSDAPAQQERDAGNKQRLHPENRECRERQDQHRRTQTKTLQLLANQRHVQRYGADERGIEIDA
jgi:hypothetical protein